MKPPTRRDHRLDLAPGYQFGNPRIRIIPISQKQEKDA